MNDEGGMMKDEWKLWRLQVPEFCLLNDLIWNGHHSKIEAANIHLKAGSVCRLIRLFKCMKGRFDFKGHYI